MSGLTKRTVVKIAALIIGPALFAQGCLLGPNFKAPPVAVADKWIEEGNKSVDPSAAEHRDWWTAFNDPVLNDLIQLAYQRNLTLQSAGVRVLEARAAWNRYRRVLPATTADRRIVNS